MEEKSLSEFKGRERWLALFDSPNPDFKQFMNVPGLDTFVEQNKAEIDNLIKQDMIARKVINQFISPDHDQLIQGLETINADAETQKIVMREKTQAQIFDGINSKFGDKFMNFEDRVSFKTKAEIDLILGWKSNSLFGQTQSHCRWFECQRMPSSGWK